jgi:predicted PurR-regulated permease PerM
VACPLACGPGSTSRVVADWPRSCTTCGRRPWWPPVDAIVIGIGLAILQVPLAMPLATLVFLGAFIPIIGAVATGAAAVLVALVAQGPITALIVLAIIIGVMQLESHVLHRCCGRAVALHPLAVVCRSVRALRWGIAGFTLESLMAVPLQAVLNAGHPVG